MLLAFCSSCLRVGDFYNGFSTLLQFSESDECGNDIQKAVSDLLERWKTCAIGSIIKSLSLPFLSPRIFEFQWRAPSVFNDMEKIPSDFCYFITVSEVQVNNRSIGFRVDQVRDFVIERWGPLGSIGLAAYQDLVNFVLTRPDISHNVHLHPHWLSSGYSITATYHNMSICAICQDTEWTDLLQLFLWLDGTTGVPEAAGFSKHIYNVERLTHHMDENEYTGELSSNHESLKSMRDYLLELAKMKINLLNRHVSIKDDDIAMSSLCIEKVNRAAESPQYCRIQTRCNDLCWTSLFERAFLNSCSLPLPMHIFNGGRGLGASFDLLVSISGVEKAMILDGGLILVGFCAALIPMEIINARDNSVQWHFVGHEDKETCIHAIHNCETFWNNLPKTRLLETSLSKLNGLAYVGYHEEVRISLGIKNAQAEYSHLPRITERWENSQKGISMGLSYPIPFGPTASVQRTRGSTKVETMCRYRPAQHFSMRVKSLYLANSFIYDDDRQTAWLCPTIYLILFMLRYHLESDSSIVPEILFPVSCATLGQDHAFVKSVKQLEQLDIPDDLNMKYGDLIKLLHDRFDDAYASIRAVRRRHKNSLFGFDLRDMINLGKETVFPRELKIENGIQYWSCLVDTDAVVFCKNIGEIIEPVMEFSVQPILYPTPTSTISISSRPANRDTGACLRQCLIPPKRENILVCPLYLLKQKLEARSFRDDPKLGGIVVSGPGGYQWKFTGNPYKCSEQRVGLACDGRRCWRYRLQQLETIAHIFLKLNNVSTTSVFRSGATFSLDSGGALCFGEIK